MFKNKLREFREDRGVTQAQIAEFLNMSSTGYGAYERGDTEPSIETLVRICTYLRVKSDELLGIMPNNDETLQSDLKLTISILQKHIK